MQNIEYLIPRKTELRNSVLKYDGESKDKKWMQIEGVPCKIVSIENVSNSLILNSFANADNANFRITFQDANDNFIRVEPDKYGYLNLDKYRESIHVSEFDKKGDVKIFKASIDKLVNNPNLSKNLKKIFVDKLRQLFVSQGNDHCITISEYQKYKTEDVDNCHKRKGDPIFNRKTRFCPPIDITYEEFEKSPSYPAPIGIRPKDFCLPSNLIDTVKEMINQVMNFKNIKDEDFQLVHSKLSFVEKRPTHYCKYCGEELDIDKYSSEYKSSDNYIEICHRDPDGNFTKENMYWGHGECNRKQGGYSESSRINDGFLLAYINGIIDKSTYDMLLSKLN
tara:strand:- start:2380 stop:3390 length:1011 start_codon:yes stop_codon:yes gene_type:complete